jgi:hypothetical protein
MKTILARIVAISLACAPAAAFSQVSISAGAEFTSGKFGDPQKTDSWTVPIGLKYETGPLTFRLSVPWVRVKGTANRETGETINSLVNASTPGQFIRGDGSDECLVSGNGKPEDDPPAGCPNSAASTVTTTAATTTAPVVTRVPQSQSGLGDVTASAFFIVLDPAESVIGLDLGGKVKFATADRDKCLITTGENDYSAQAELYQTFGRLSPYLTLGWTKKGDPELRDGTCTKLGGRTNFENPWYLGIGFSYKLSDATSAGLSYDFRQKLLAGSDPVSEASLFVSQKLAPNFKLQVYGIAGFSDNSPDWGLGATVGYTF